MGRVRRKRIRIPRTPELIIEDFDNWEDEARYIEAARKRGYIQTEDTNGETDHEKA